MSPGRYEVEAPCTFPGETALDVAHELPEQETIIFINIIHNGKMNTIFIIFVAVIMIFGFIISRIFIVVIMVIGGTAGLICMASAT